MTVSLVWSTPDGDSIIARLARVSNPANQDNDATAPRLIGYLIRHKHWSPFEMASMCVDVTTTRDISRQLLRHRSFSFQEFSQRYALVPDDPQWREPRLQASHNRQASIETEDCAIHHLWSRAQAAVWRASMDHYKAAVEHGIAKEQARALLPEGLTPTRLYMAGTVRSWLHFCEVRRREAGAQKEISAIASAIAVLLREQYPLTWEAWEASQ